MLPGVTSEAGRLAIVMSGGGARAAYQVGLLQVLAKHRPEFTLDILTGVSAGAINAAHLAGHPGSFAAATDALSGLWLGLSTERVFRTDWLSLLERVLCSGIQLVSGGRQIPGRARGMVDTEPLRRFLYGALAAEPAGGALSGVGENLVREKLRAVALSRPSPPYSSGTSMLRRPISPAPSSSVGTTPGLFSSISAIRGITSRSTNSSAVRAVARWSSVKSSGVKISSGTGSIRKDEPIGTLMEYPSEGRRQPYKGTRSR